MAKCCWCEKPIRGGIYLGKDLIIHEECDRDRKMKFEEQRLLDRGEP